jgi:hypothetical protein
MNLIEKYKEQIEAGLKEASQWYLVENSLELSPRWFNVHGILDHYDKDGNEIYDLKIKSTQCPAGFNIRITREEMEFYRREGFRNMWEDFKRFRTKWLEENYPQIPRY